MKKIILSLAFILTILNGYSQNNNSIHKTDSASKNIEIAANDLEVEFPEIIIAGLENELKFKALSPAIQNATIAIQLNGESKELAFLNGEGVIKASFENEQTVVIKAQNFSFSKDINPIPLWLSILPPLLAIIIALISREVLSSLFLGIFIGAATIGFYAKGFTGIFTGLLAVLDKYILESLNNSDHLSVILFSMIIGGMVTVISKNGGMAGVVNKISKYAQNAKSGQVVTWFLGVVIFFDDYANTLVVGNTMRPVTDRLKISREKLSYLVDSTAAPVAAIAFVTTWIGAELGYIKDSVAAIDGLNESAYSIFLNSLQYAFYPIFTLAFMLILILRNRDFGPMYKAEVRARTTGAVSRISTQGSTEAIHEELASLEPKQGTKLNMWNAIIPVSIIIFGTLAGLVMTGYQADVWSDTETGVMRKISQTIGNANSYKALLWSSLGGLLAAVGLTIGQKIMKIHETMETAMKGFKTMLTAIMILVLAWSLAMITEDLHTADFITRGLLSIDLSPALIPAVTFLLAGIVAFSTGSSWGTMAILYPLMLPASWLVCVESGYDHEATLMIFYNVVSCVLAGSVLGDHSSPISDTTILSSLASNCNHIDHVNTQLPYALTVGVVAILIGTIPGALGLSSLVTIPLGIVAMYFLIGFVGKKVE